MSNTSLLNLPYLAAGQAQKHVTLNEGLRMLDALVQLAVKSRIQTTPPATPSEGDRYILPGSPAGSWASHGGSVAAYQDGGWNYFLPRTGWLAWVGDEAAMFVFDGAGWVRAGGDPQSVEQLGIHATADTTNRLALASAASLFNHDGAGHQLKINKAATAQTASLLFQTGFSGRAEMGIAGSDNFVVKTSGDGSNWATAIEIDPAGQCWIGPHLINTWRTSGGPTLEAALGIPGDRVAYFDFHASDSQPDYSSRFIRTAGANGDFEVQNVGSGYVRMRAEGGSVRFNTGNIDRVAVDGSGHFVPVADNTYQLGAAGARFSAVWAANGLIQTSDARDKDIDAPMGGTVAVAMIEAVEPVLYRWKDGGRTVEVASEKQETFNPDNPRSKTRRMVETRSRTRKGVRLHAGFRAQDLRAALDRTGLDFAVWGLEDANDPQSRQWLRPDQLIPVLWAALRETRSELRRLAQDQKREKA